VALQSEFTKKRHVRGREIFKILNPPSQNTKEEKGVLKQGIWRENRNKLQRGNKRRESEMLTSQQETRPQQKTRAAKKNETREKREPEEEILRETESQKEMNPKNN